MAAANLQPLIDEMTADETIIDGATTFIQGVPALIQAGIDQALAGGATATQLAGVQSVVDAITQKSAALQAAIVAGTPVPPAV